MSISFSGLGGLWIPWSPTPPWLRSSLMGPGRVWQTCCSSVHEADGWWGRLQSTHLKEDDLNMHEHLLGGARIAGVKSCHKSRIRIEVSGAFIMHSDYKRYNPTSAKMSNELIPRWDVKKTIRQMIQWPAQLCNRDGAVCKQYRCPERMQHNAQK